jgi:hypothetical protein
MGGGGEYGVELGIFLFGNAGLLLVFVVAQ